MWQFTAFSIKCWSSNCPNSPESNCSYLALICLIKELHSYQVDWFGHDQSENNRLISMSKLLIQAKTHLYSMKFKPKLRKLDILLPNWFCTMSFSFEVLEISSILIHRNRVYQQKSERLLRRLKTLTQ